MSQNVIRDQFPQLKRKIHGKQLIYLDSAATTLKPQSVIVRLSRFYSYEYGTVRRGWYLLSQGSSEMYVGIRALNSLFLNSPMEDDICIVYGVTVVPVYSVNTIHTGMET